MREINNKNINGLNYQGIQKTGETQAPTDQAQVQNTEAKEIKDLANMPSATLGKSQISTDSIENDMKFLDKNSKLAQAINEAIDKYAETHSDTETLQFIEKVHQELVAKK
jgi:hypothetical protein